MSEDFVTHKQALALKKLGFNWELNRYYTDKGSLIYDAFADDFNVGSGSASAPTLSLAQKWLLSNHEIFVTSDIRFSNYQSGNYSDPKYQYMIVDMRKENVAYRIESVYRGVLFNSPEEALSAGITECLKLIENETSKTSQKNNNP